MHVFKSLAVCVGVFAGRCVCCSLFVFLVMFFGLLVVLFVCLYVCCCLLSVASALWCLLFDACVASYVVVLCFVCCLFCLFCLFCLLFVLFCCLVAVPLTIKEQTDRQFVRNFGCFSYARSFVCVFMFLCFFRM